MSVLKFPDKEAEFRANVLRQVLKVYENLPDVRRTFERIQTNPAYELPNVIKAFEGVKVD